jgi:hypothetical protein
MEKQCFKCLVTKPLDCFYKHKKMADGHLNKCKECNKKDVSANYRENIDHYKQYEKSRANLEHRVEARKKYSKTEKGKISASASVFRFVKTHPIQRAANIIVGNAIRDKRLIRPNKCSSCGIDCKPQGHHCDYAYPLVVTWLCTQCHANWHKVNTPLNGG